MKSYQNIITGLFLLCTLLSSTCKEDLTGSGKAKLGTAFKLARSEKVIFTDANLLLELNEINDSRCPVNVQCVWAGNAKAKLLVSGASGEKISLDFCLGQCDSGLKETDTISFKLDNESYSIVLNKIEPYPGTGDAKTKKNAVFILQKN